MRSCALCGTELKNAFCSFCDMELEDRYIMKDGKRLNQSDFFEGFPESTLLFQGTKELMKLAQIAILS